MVRDKIFIAFIQRKKDFTGQKEDAPPIKPSPRVVIMRAQHTHDLRPILVHLREPEFRCFRIVPPINRPSIGQTKRPVKVLEDIETRHDAALKKIFGHPVRITLYLVKVEQRFMTKNMDKQFSTVLEQQIQS